MITISEETFGFLIAVPIVCYLFWYLGTKLGSIGALLVYELKINDCPYHKTHEDTCSICETNKDKKSLLVKWFSNMGGLLCVFYASFLLGGGIVSPMFASSYVYDKLKN